MDKSALRTALLRQLESDLALQLAAARSSHDEATSEESRAENKYDTRAQEAAYLAEGQSRLVAEIHESIAHYTALPLPDFTTGQPAALGAIVTLRGGGKEQTCFLGPRAGGLELTVDGRAVLVLTPASPLGRLLIGRRVGDIVLPPSRGKPIPHTVTAIE